MLSTLIVAFPQNALIPNIFLNCISFVASCLSKDIYDENALELWYLVAKEYCFEQGLDQQMLQLKDVSPLCVLSFEAVLDGRRQLVLAPSCEVPGALHRRGVLAAEHDTL